MLGCKIRNWWILKYSCPKHNLKNNIPQVLVEPMPNNEIEMVEINLQDNNEPDQESTIPIDVIPQNDISEDVQDETDETTEDGVQDVQILIRRNKNGKFKSKNVNRVLTNPFCYFSSDIYMYMCMHMLSDVRESYLQQAVYVYQLFNLLYNIFNVFYNSPRNLFLSL